MRHLHLSLALAVGLCIAHTPSMGQDIADPDDPPQNSQDDEADEVDQADEAKAPATPPPPPKPPPPSLRDLIPDAAVEDSENWATRGTDAPAASQDLTAREFVQSATEDAQSSPIQPLPGDFAEDEQALSLPDEIAAPEPLDPAPNVTALAEIDAPDLLELPELEESRVSDALILAFPADNDRFPERTNFLERFKALSTIEALDSGEETVPQLAARARADEELLVRVLRTYGYYQGEAVRQLSGGRRGDNGDAQTGEAASDPQVRFDILPGPLYRFGSIDLGELDNVPMPEGGELVAAFEIASGDPLYGDRIPEEIGDLRVKMGESGYPFAEIGEPSLLIDHARLEGDLTVPVNPGGKYVFAGVVSDDPRFLSGRHMERIARFDEGDVYKTSLQADLRRAILATGLVSTVVVNPREVTPPGDGEPGQVALDVSVERAPLRTISGAIGYGTEEGIRLEAGWEHRNLFPPEGALRLRGIFGTQEQLASVSFQRSNFRARDQILTIDAYASDIDTDAIDARTIALRGTFERISNLLFQKDFSWAFGAEVLFTDARNSQFFQTDLPRQEYLIGGLFGRATIDGSDDLLDPTRGFRITGEIAPDISRTEGVTSFYIRTGIDAAYYQSVGGTVVAGRAAVQTINGAGIFDIAPTRRLYAGGGASVRGYAFQAIGPRDEFGNPIGGRSLVELNLEARIPTPFFDGALEVVPFIDAGSVDTNPTPDFGLIRFGAGVGIRYKTSFGPIRVDVGVPLNPDEFDSPVAVYVSLGQAF